MDRGWVWLMKPYLLSHLWFIAQQSRSTSSIHAVRHPVCTIYGA